MFTAHQTCRLLRHWILTATLLLSAHAAWALALQSRGTRQISGMVVTQKDEVLRGITVIARGAGFERWTATGDNGEFSLQVPGADVTLRLEGQYIRTRNSRFPPTALQQTCGWKSIPDTSPFHQSIVIVASALEPERRNQECRGLLGIHSSPATINYWTRWPQESMRGSMKAAESRWRSADSDSIRTMEESTAV